MDLHHLEQFLAVAEAGSFTRAAGRLGRTQPAVSQSIKKLEEEIGSLLFARDLHDVTLTATGMRLAEYARRMLKLRDEAMRALGEVQDLSVDRLSIAAHEAAALYLLPPLLRAFLHKFKAVRIGVYRSPLDEVQRQVLHRQVDLGFVSHDTGFKELETVLVCSDRMVLIVSPRHPLAGRTDLGLEDLGRQRFVLHHGCPTTAAKITRLFEEHRTPFHVCAELWSFENIKDFVQQDVGVSIVPRVTVSRELALGTLIEVPVAGLDIPRRTYVMFRDRRYLADSARGFLNIVGQLSDETKSRSITEATGLPLPIAINGDLPSLLQ